MGSRHEGARRADRRLRRAARARSRRGRRALLKAYRAFDEIGKLQYRLYRYPQLQRDVDTRDQAVARRASSASARSFAKFDTATAWFTPELLTIPEATVARLDRADARARALPLPDPRQLPPPGARARRQGRAAALARRPASTARRGSIYQELITSDIKFPTHEARRRQGRRAQPGNYGRAARDEPEPGRARQGRRGARRHLSAPPRNTYAAIYDGMLQRDWFLAQARNFPIDARRGARRQRDPARRRRDADRRDARRLGAVPALRAAAPEAARPAELPPLRRVRADLPQRQARTRTSEARELALASVAPLGADYVAKYRRFVSGGRIDVYENEGKRSGAYSAGVYGVGPYLLMNYNDTLDAAFTLAHEAGHAMHTVLSYESQPFVTAGYTIFVAEVASTTNERFLLDELLQADERSEGALPAAAARGRFDRRHLLHAGAVRRLRAARAPAGREGRAAHDRGAERPVRRPAEGVLGRRASPVDDFYKCTWARIPHFFNTPYYVYQYATCFASSAQLYDGDDDRHRPSRARPRPSAT